MKKKMSESSDREVDYDTRNVYDGSTTFLFPASPAAGATLLHEIPSTVVVPLS